MDATTEENPWKPAAPMQPARTVLICHHDEPLNRFALARWLASFTELAAIIVIHEPPARLQRRIRREIGRAWVQARSRAAKISL